jgi:ABC-2 type transport system permease protein
MNNPSLAGSESMEARAVAPSFIHSTRPFLWSVRRELWEFRSIYIAPAAVACVALVGFVIGTIGRGLATQDLARRQAVLQEPTTFAASMVMLASVLIAVFYCLDALHGERRDRSILFWKSLPVSDRTTVLAKASVAIVIIPLVTFVVSFAMQLIMAVLSSLALLGSGMSVGMLWTHFAAMSVMLLYHLAALHGLSLAPIYAWMLLVSAWARRTPFLWAFLPVLVLGIGEKIAFGSWHFAHALAYIVGGGNEGDAYMAGSKSMAPLSLISPLHFLFSPGLWIGLAVTAILLAAAVRLRRHRGPI